MKHMKWKKAAALVMASVMMMSMAACGKKEKTSSKKTKENKKEMTYEATDLEIDGIKGDINTCVVSGDRIYFYTYEWIEGDSEEGENPDAEPEDGTSEEAEGEDTEAETSEEDTSEETGEEETSEEDTSEETGEEETSEEDTSEETGEEETSEEDSSEEADGEDVASADADVEDTEEEEAMDEYPAGTTNYYLYSIKTDGTDLQELGKPELADTEYINYMLVASDGTIQLIISSYDEKSQKSSYKLAAVDENGKFTAEEDVTEMLGITEENYLSKVMMDNKDRYVFATDQAIIVLDKDFKKVCEMKPESNYVEAVAVTKDGQIICGNSSGEEGAKVQVLDVENKKWGESFKIGLSYFSGSDSLMNGIEYDFYYRDDAGVYGYDMASKKGTKLMDFVASNISSEYSYGIFPVGKDQMLGTVWDESGSRFVLYKKVDPSSIKDKETITVGAMYLDENVKKAAIAFNKENDKYQIEFTDYSNEEDPQTKMNADIVAGNVPDIICLSGMPIDQYAAKGILEDLTPYYEKDPDVKLDDLIPSVQKAMQIDGKIYYVAPGFYVNTLVAAAKDVGTEPGWTMDDLKKLLDEKSGARPFYSENKNDTLYSFMMSNINDFVDWTTGECSFDGQDFKDILEISNRGSDEEMEYSEDSPSQPSLIKEGKVLFVDGGGMDMESVELYEKMYNGDITFIGYPNEEKNGSYFTFDTQVGIYSKSKVKDAAWEFVKTFMTLKYQGDRNNVWANPTRQDAFDMLVKSKTATKKYTDELGNEVEPLDSSWGWDDLEVQIVPLSDKQAQQYIDLVNSTTKTSDYNTEITDIITEEAKAYFAGQKSLDETAEIIQNRVKTYVNENR